MKYLSLFTGIGGFELGIQQAYESNNEHAHISEKSKSQERSQGRKRSIDKHEVQLRTGNRATPLCIGYSEIDKYAIQIFEKQFPNIKNYGDITTINAKELPDFELLVGGFPCQSFSIAGKRGGFNDTRGTLFFDIARIVREKQPRLLLLENVKGLLSHDQGRTFFTIISTLDELGYDTQWQVLNSKNFGVPQNRERVFVIGHLRGTSRPEVFPFRETSTNDIKYKRNHIRQQYRTISKEGISPCLAANTTFDKWNVEDEIKIRRLTPLECERLQGFPDGWTEGLSDTQRYKTLGNAVTVNVIKAIVEKLLKAHDKKREQ